MFIINFHQILLQLERPYVNEDSSPWSSILRQTSSAVESMADINEIGKRPRRGIGTEKKILQGKAKAVSDNSASVQMHKHTHHHYYIHDKGEDEAVDSLWQYKLAHLRLLFHFPNFAK